MIHESIQASVYLQIEWYSNIFHEPLLQFRDIRIYFSN